MLEALSIRIEVKDGYLIIRLIQTHDQGDVTLSEDLVAVSDILSSQKRY